MSKQGKKDWDHFKKENQAIEDSDTDALYEEVKEEPAGLDHPSYLALEEQLTLAEQKAHEHWEQSVRAAAELDNVRRRMEREVANAHKYGVEKLISSLLPVLDSLGQALQIAQKNADSAMYEGLDLTMKLFTDALQKFDVEEINPIGEVFDPQQHEAMSILDVPNTAPNTVIEVFQNGYKLSDRVIRPARVIVSKNK